MFQLLDFVYENCLFRQFKINDLLFLEYKCVAEESFMKIWSQHNYFVFVISGKKIWQTITSKYMVTKGQAIFVKRGANVVHQFFDKNFCSLIIFVPDNFIREVIQCHYAPMSEINRMDKNTDSVIRIHLDHVLSAYFHSVFAYFEHSQDPPKDLLELKFKELILDLISSPENGSLAMYFKSLCNTSKSSIREIMESNFAYNMKLNEFARLSGRSLTSFKRDFKEMYKISPGKWLARKKIEYARHLLETTDKNVNELTSDCGFENPSHFIKNFREAYSMTPLQFKKSMLKTVFD